jgi:hypothetical protein
MNKKHFKINVRLFSGRHEDRYYIAACVRTAIRNAGTRTDVDTVSSIKQISEMEYKEGCSTQTKSKYDRRLI